MLVFHRIASYLMILTGAVHTALTPAFYSALAPDALWFAGTGLALVFLGLTNIAANITTKTALRVLAILANIIGTVYSVLIVIALPQPQAYAAIAVFLLVTISSLFLRNKPDSPENSEI